MTQIRFGRSGGAVGRELHLSLDLRELTEDESQNLEKLINDANFFEIPEDLMASATSDEFRYNISVETDNGSHTVRASDTTMPRSLLPLVKELTMLNMLKLE